MCDQRDSSATKEASYNLLRYIYIMSSLEQNTLKWGDLIRIHGVNLNKHEQ